VRATLLVATRSHVQQARSSSAAEDEQAPLACSSNKQRGMLPGMYPGMQPGMHLSRARSGVACIKSGSTCTSDRTDGTSLPPTSISGQTCDSSTLQSGAILATAATSTAATAVAAITTVTTAKTIAAAAIAATVGMASSGPVATNTARLPVLPLEIWLLILSKLRVWELGRSTFGPPAHTDA
jgi:hypothetical protein